jgi:SulP family sulfate permease
VRSADEEVYLGNLNQSIRIYELQGFLFFGTAHNFYTKIKNDLQDKSSPIRHVILSFKHVSGVDASAEQILQKIFLAADKQNASISTIELPTQEQTTVARLLRRSPTLIADQNYAAIYDAMEAIEENLLRERDFEGSRVSLQGWLDSRLGDTEMAEKLFRSLERVDYKSGDIICSQGEEANEIFFLDIGRVDVVSYDIPSQPFRIYSFMRHTMLGEMGFVRKEARSAQLVARGSTTVYSLSRETYDRLEAANDPVIDTLLQLISITLSDRIISANRTIAELQA